MKESGKSSRINKCPVSDKCGGCQYIDLSYDRQLKEKQRAAEKLIALAGGQACRHREELPCRIVERETFVYED